VAGNTVYALLSDALYLTEVNAKLQFDRHYVSQLVAIDVTDLTNPKVLSTVDIIGELREGFPARSTTPSTWFPTSRRPTTGAGATRRRATRSPSRPGFTPSTCPTQRC